MSSYSTTRWDVNKISSRKHHTIPHTKSNSNQLDKNVNNNNVNYEFQTQIFYSLYFEPIAQC